MRIWPLLMMLVFLFGCNPVAKVGENAVRQNETNVKYLAKQLNKYLDADTEADRDVVKDKKLAIDKSVSLAEKMSKQFDKE